jgi:hypothetical protein
MKLPLPIALVAMGLSPSASLCIRRKSTPGSPSSTPDSLPVVAASTGFSETRQRQAETQARASLATWIWNTTLITDATETSQFLTFAQEQGLQRAYLHVDADIDKSYFGNFIQQCTANSIEVEALIGNAQWILGSGTPSLQSNLEWIDQYQGNASADARFSGIHMDVEVCRYHDGPTPHSSRAVNLEGSTGDFSSRATDAALTSGWG